MGIFRYIATLATLKLICVVLLTIKQYFNGKPKQFAKIHHVATEVIKFEIDINALAARVQSFEQMVEMYILIKRKVDANLASTDEYLRSEILLITIGIEEGLLRNSIAALHSV